MMGHRYATRSNTPTGMLDYIQGLPQRRSSRRRSSLPATGPNPPNQQALDEEIIVEVRNDSVDDDRQIDTEDEVTSLPCFNNSFSGIPEIITCSVCFEAMSRNCEPTATRCGHIFCAGCLAMSLKKYKRCPTCQSFMRFGSSIRLYF